MLTRLLQYLVYFSCCLFFVAFSEFRSVVAYPEIDKLSNTGPHGRGIYKVGEPYRIKGMWYCPYENYGYRETGMASWYGVGFHGKKTANGEMFDMNTLSAAHRTLPMPSIVVVTNLTNGRVLTVQVNDRGPFVNDRIIDLSRRAAQLLGFEGQGTTWVRVEILAEESHVLKRQLLKTHSIAVHQNLSTKKANFCRCRDSDSFLLPLLIPIPREPWRATQRSANTFPNIALSVSKNFRRVTRGHQLHNSRMSCRSHITSLAAEQLLGSLPQTRYAVRTPAQSLLR